MTPEIHMCKNRKHVKRVVMCFPHYHVFFKSHVQVTHAAHGPMGFYM